MQIKSRPRVSPRGRARARGREAGGRGLVCTCDSISPEPTLKVLVVFLSSPGPQYLGSEFLKSETLGPKVDPISEDERRAAWNYGGLGLK